MSRHLYASPHPELALFAITCKSNELAKHYEKEKETEIAGLIFNATRQLLMAYRTLSRTNQKRTGGGQWLKHL